MKEEHLLLSNLSLRKILMDKRISRLFVIIVLLCLISNLFSEERSFFVQGSVGTSAIFQSDEFLSSFKQNLLKDDFKRIVLYMDAGLGFRIDPSISIVGGGIFLPDWYFHKENQLIYLNYDFYCGIRVNLTNSGFCFGVDYLLGNRKDIYLLDDSYTVLPEINNFWSNGFRFVGEYDFSEGNIGLAPCVGLSWICIPRFESFDNQLCVYFKISFR